MNQTSNILGPFGKNIKYNFPKNLRHQSRQQELQVARQQAVELQLKQSHQRRILKRVSKRSYYLSRRTMITRMNREMLRAKQSVWMQSTRFSNFYRTKSKLLHSSYRILMMWWPWLRRTSLGHFQMLKNRTWPFLKQALKQKMKSIQPGLTFRESMNSSYNSS